MQKNRITYEDASRIAYDFIRSTVFDGIGKAYDMGDYYMFIADDPDIVYYTCRSLRVNKNTGAVEWYTYEDTLENQKMEQSKNELDVITDYSYKVQGEGV